MLAVTSTVGFKCEKESYDQQAAFKQHENPGACARVGLTVLVGTKHSNQAQKQERPAAEGNEHCPVPHPDVVSADYRQAGEEEQDSREVDDRRDLCIVEMWLHKRELGDKHGDHGGAEKRCNLL